MGRDGRKSRPRLTALLGSLLPARGGSATFEVTVAPSTYLAMFAAQRTLLRRLPEHWSYFDNGSRLTVPPRAATRVSPVRRVLAICFVYTPVLVPCVPSAHYRPSSALSSSSSPGGPTRQAKGWPDLALQPAEGATVAERGVSIEDGRGLRGLRQG